MPRPKDRPSPLPWIAAVAAIVALAGAAFGPAYMAAVATLDAMQRADAKALENNIDFVALRTDVSDELKAMFDAEMRKQGLDETAVGVARNFVAAPINAIVDRIATPDGMAALLTPPSGEDRKLLTTPQLLSATLTNGQLTSLSQLEVAIPYGKKPRAELVRLKFKRNGLTDWRMVGVHYPASALAGAAGLPATP
ncbi:MAG: DUF2939 domain-containing protein [Caulobacterales bacterium]